jgi:hypothetical protein
MSLFLLSKTLCHNLNRLMSRFWWGKSSQGKSFSWLAWSKLGASKLSEGMGFWDLEVFNQALLAKQGWSLIQYPDSLVAVILKEKYFTGSDFQQARLGHNPSYAWRSIMQARKVLEKGLMWRVGNGANIRIKNDKWLQTPPTFQVQSPCLGLEPNARVSSLIDPITG